MAQILASRLKAIGIVSDKGLQVGKLRDILFDEKDGKIHALVVKPISKKALGDVPRDESGNALVPFTAVVSIRDFIVINERVLSLQQIKAQKLRITNQKITSSPARQANQLPLSS